MAELWNALVDGMGTILAFLYAGLPSYGLAIIGLTVLVRLVLFPLTAKQARSMQKMQWIQPEIKKIQAKYKDDKQKQNEEVMKFYKENKVNPLAGCLPLVAQMPIFFALFRVLRFPHKHVPVDSKLYEAFCGAQTVAECGKGSGPRGLGFLGMNLAESPNVAAQSGVLHALPYFVLIALVVATGYLQFKQTQARQSATSQPNPQAQMMGKIFPVMFAFISFSLPAGVVLYFLVSNAWQIGQQAIIFGSLTGTEPVPDKAPPKGAGKPAAREPGRPAAREGGAPAKDGKRDRAEASPEAKPAPPEKARPPGPGRTGDGSGRAQPSGSRPRPRKRRR